MLSSVLLVRFRIYELPAYHSFLLLILDQGGFWFAFAATMIPAFNAAGQFLRLGFPSYDNEMCVLT